MSTRLLATEVEELLRLLWPAVSIGDGASDDSQRWYQQGFELQSLRDFPLGLVQGHGGPCGVLAAVQAEMLRLFLFVRHRYTLSNNDFNLQQLMEHERLAEDEAARRQLLAEAMASLLVQCVGDDRAVHVVVQEDADKGAAATYRECTISVPFMPTENSPPDLVELLYHEMPAFCSPHGVINFTFSVLRTKGVAAVREEMDDPANTLTGAFGHCTQELVNLLLTGNAVSNVFDGSVPMGDTGLFLHGVPQRARIGYLTQLEALRYCQVGSYYKSPQFPVWVLGSSSHFSVGFALDARVCEESASAQLFQRVQRVFKTFDPMETGFMEMASLAESLKQLGVAPEILSNEYWMARLLARLEISSGAGIVLWDEYWTVISVLLHTNDFELALSGEYDANATTESRSPLQRSDSDLARELQAQFDAEERGDSSAQAPVNLQSSRLPPGEPKQDPLLSFDWFYYNGLGSKCSSSNSQRRPQLTKCRVTLEESTEFIGKSVPIENSGTSGGHGSPPLEEIMKTKWPSARIDWLGSPVPCID
ncbi:hypothetical protein PC121_g2935 [Phytophthora cactorum]|nr:hypothetical protein PC120_g2880 [Phytophthora cactorum]KAG3094809.1 hypothetical protein PC121_g2935 [Phytophthora cactorum]KAG4061689.1 hypothetical protein PC123_g3447 [Phytophthora cactorum]